MLSNRSLFEVLNFAVTNGISHGLVVDVRSLVADRLGPLSRSGFPGPQGLPFYIFWAIFERDVKGRETRFNTICLEKN